MSQAELIASILLKYGPEAARLLVNIFKLKDPTPADWETLFAVAEKSYFDLVPDSKLPH